MLASSTQVDTHVARLGEEPHCLIAAFASPPSRRVSRQCAASGCARAVKYVPPAAVTVFVIVGATLYKVSVLSGGGARVAEQMASIMFGVLIGDRMKHDDGICRLSREEQLNSCSKNSLD